MTLQPEFPFTAPLVCPGRDLNVDFIKDTCRECGRQVMRHKGWPAWIHFLCVWCFVGANSEAQA